MGFACGISYSQNIPARLLVVLIWSLEARGATLAVLRADLALMVDWGTEVDNDLRMMLHTSQGWSLWKCVPLLPKRVINQRSACSLLEQSRVSQTVET